MFGISKGRPSLPGTERGTVRMLQSMIGHNSPLSRLRERQRVRLAPMRRETARRTGLTNQEERLLHRILAALSC